MMRKILISITFAQFLWMIHNTGGFSALLRRMVRVQYIEDRSLLEESAGSSQSSSGSTAVKDGVNILFDEKSVSIFHLEERREDGND